MSASTADTKFFSLDRVPSEFFGDIDSLQTEFHKRQMEGKRRSLQAMLDGGRLAEARRPKIQRLLWAITGILDHNLSIKRLFKVMQIYERINVVP